jgi:hypothetical protein
LNNPKQPRDTLVLENYFMCIFNHFHVSSQPRERVIDGTNPSSRLIFSVETIFTFRVVHHTVSLVKNGFFDGVTMGGNGKIFADISHSQAIV